MDCDVAGEYFVLQVDRERFELIPHGGGDIGHKKHLAISLPGQNGFIQKTEQTG